MPAAANRFTAAGTGARRGGFTIYRDLLTAADAFARRGKPKLPAAVKHSVVVVDKFIEAAEKHATTLIENKDTIICPYKDYKNLIAWTDVTITRSHLIIREFVKDYTV